MRTVWEGFTASAESANWLVRRSVELEPVLVSVLAVDVPGSDALASSVPGARPEVARSLIVAENSEEVGSSIRTAAKVVIATTIAVTAVSRATRLFPDDRDAPAAVGWP